MKLTLMEFLSLDGVSQGPGSPEGDPSDGFTQGGWLVPHIDEAFIRQTAAWLGEADAGLAIQVYGDRPAALGDLRGQHGTPMKVIEQPSCCGHQHAADYAQRLTSLGLSDVAQRPLASVPSRPLARPALMSCSRHG